MQVHPDQVPEQDPCPTLPTTFRTASRVAKIVEKSISVPADSADVNAADVDAADVDEPVCTKYYGPQRVLRTVLSSMVCSDDFGPMMQREAQRRRFYEAPLQAFLGDGLNWNWSIWQKYFPTFVPILDFIHAIEYIFSASMARTSTEAAGWSDYVRLITLCWQGEVDLVIEAFRQTCRDRGLDLDEPLADDDPLQPLAEAVRYLTNNRSRMDYPRYRRLGLPVTSAPMESLIKQMNLRVKGTEMFWDDPEGAESILRLRSAALSEDGRLDDYLAQRPG